MNAYAYQAALYCEDCAQKIMRTLQPAEGSDSYPQGPYDDGGGEADCPNHCDGCSTFLENPLTDDGYRYVLDSIREHIAGERTDADVLKEWAARYDVTAAVLIDGGGAK